MMMNWEDKWNELLTEDRTEHETMQKIEHKKAFDQMMKPFMRKFWDAADDPRKLDHFRAVMSKALDELDLYGKKPATSMRDLGFLGDMDGDST